MPVIAVTGTNGKTTTVRMIAHIAKRTGRTVGMASTDGVYIGRRRINRHDASGPRSARMVLQNRRVDFAVLEVARGGILRDGLGYDRNDVAVVLNVEADHLGVGGIHTLHELAAVKQVVVEAVPRDGVAVLNADDPLVAAMASACLGEVIYLSMAACSALIDAHCSRGGRSVRLAHSGRGDAIVLQRGARTMHVVWTHQIPATFGGRAEMNVQNAMAAAAAALAAGISLEDVRHGLRTFDSTTDTTPGRLNAVEVDGATVVVDYCHNAPALRQLGRFLDRITVPSVGDVHRLAVIGVPGDRRDQDLVDMGAVAARHFDTLILRDDRLRGREPGDAPRIIATGIEHAGPGRRCTRTLTILDEQAACEQAIALLTPGDVALLCVDDWRAAFALLHGRTAPHRWRATGQAPS